MKRLIFICFVLLIAGSSNAVWYPHEDSGVTVDIPRSWKVTGDANSLQAKTKDGNAAVFMRVMPAEKAEAAHDDHVLDGRLALVELDDLAHGLVRALARRTGRGLDDRQQTALVFRGQEAAGQARVQQ